MFKDDDIQNLENILWAISKIENSLNGIKSSLELDENEEKYDSVIVKLMNIGESAKNLSSSLKAEHSTIDWEGMYFLRNIISHAYHNLDVDIVWDIVKKELPLNKKLIEVIYKSESLKGNQNNE